VEKETEKLATKGVYDKQPNVVGTRRNNVT
jgi:hypothetical protein